MKYYLGIGSKEVKAYFDNTNVNIGMGCSILSLLGILMLLVFGTYGYADTRIPIGLMAASNLLMFVVCLYHRIHKKEVHHRLMIALIVCYSIGCTVGGVWLGAYFFVRDLSGMVFVIAILMGSCLFILSPIYYICYLLASFGLFFTQIYWYGRLTDKLLFQYACLMAVLMIIVLISYDQRRFSAQMQMELKHIATHSRVSDLRNRVQLEADYEKFLGQDIYVCTVSLDEFKFYNDCYGVTAGNQIQKSVADILMDLPYPGDVYQLTEDSFVVVIHGIPKQLFKNLTEKWVQEIGDIGFIGVEKAYISCNIGYVYGKPAGRPEMQDFIRISDHQRYQARRKGIGKVVGGAYADLKDETGEVNPFGRMYSSDDQDAMTGLMTMSFFKERAKKIKRMTHQQDRPYGMVYFDIVNFKSFNQHYGFLAGDELIKNTADVLKKEFEEYLIAHVTADQFVMFAFTDNIEERLQRVHDEVSRFQRGTKLELKAGVYVAEQSEMDMGLICDKAKIACDSIKNRFDICYKFYDSKMEGELRKRQYVIDRLDEALENEYIQVYYHPLMYTKTRKLCGAEALARWIDPEYGLLPPADFIPVLEQNNLIYKLDEYMIEHICKQQRKMIDEEHVELPVSFNLSRRDFEMTDTVAMVEKAVEKYDIPKNLLHVEVTESSLSENTDFLQREMKRFHQAGYRVWIDDFGSGYSSLNTLQNFEFDVLKIDMEFLRTFHDNPRTREVLRAIIDMTDRLNIQAVMEGVEHEDQYEFLQSIGCEMSQGYLFDRPEPYGQWVDFVKKHI